MLPVFKISSAMTMASLGLDGSAKGIDTTVPEAPGCVAPYSSAGSVKLAVQRATPLEPLNSSIQPFRLCTLLKARAPITTSPLQEILDELAPDPVKLPLIKSMACVPLRTAAI